MKRVNSKREQNNPKTLSSAHRMEKKENSSLSMLASHLTGQMRHFFVLVTHERNVLNCSLRLASPKPPRGHVCGTFQEGSVTGGGG
jgi:hypothetical protein